MKVFKMNLKHAMVLGLALVLGLSSCSKDSDMDLPKGDGKAALTININQPTTFKSTKDGEATPDADAVIKTVNVYVYSGGSLMANQKFDNVESNKVTISGLTTGPKEVYVGVNLPENLDKAIIANGPSAAYTTTVAELYNEEGNIAMFSSAVANTNLEEKDEGASNTVTVNVSRLLAKVTLTQKADFSEDIGIGTVSDLQFNVSNVNTKFFPLPTADHKDPNYTSPVTVGDLIAGVDAGYVGLDGTNSVFTTENTSVGIKQSENTYVSVRGKFVPAKISTYTTGGSIGEGDAITAGTTFYKVIVNAVVYFFSDKTHADALSTDNEGAQVMEYKEGLTYYNIFLNPNGLTNGEVVGVNPYDVLRNTKYNVTINKIIGLGDNKDNVDDEEIGKTTDLDVSITVEDWKTVAQEGDLVGK